MQSWLGFFFFYFDDMPVFGSRPKEADKKCLNV